MLSGEKILVTGPAGGIGFGLARSLAADNEVWGIARFSQPGERRALDEAGVVTRVVDLEAPDFSELPNDFTYLVHCAVTMEPYSYDRAIRINAEGTGLLMSRFRNVKAALVMSTLSVYAPNPDPWHAFVEEDPLGDVKGGSPTYSVSKIAEEAVARFCAREFAIPTTIARMGAAYSERGGLPQNHMQAIAEGRPVQARWDPLTYSPIHHDDINAQLAPMIAVAETPARIVNWCGDEAVSVQQWSAHMAEVLGKPAQIDVQPVPGASIGTVGDVTRMREITGPCKIHWKEGMRRSLAALYPDLVAA